MKEWKEIDIGRRKVGERQPCFIVAEIGINHNGDLEIAKTLIDMAKEAGCDAVKFQKRTPELCKLYGSALAAQLVTQGMRLDYRLL